MCDRDQPEKLRHAVRSVTGAQTRPDAKRRRPSVDEKPERDCTRAGAALPNEPGLKPQVLRNAR
ncbi:hypothetical protein SAMN03080610_01742 [Afifella marina DSM 2698]|uniref:Uncharacterized protein n=1 Tax=Afifella marina DSM 2698 TaxID=1120955 RepID=A0A1G5ND76_AFIMA|nr:hypothetical protein SAMN03080610_01742 [Afifella marina DSM 2698]